MNSGPCPHCGIITRQSRSDRRCAGCGKVLPAELIAPISLPDDKLYRDSVAKLVDRINCVGHDGMQLINDERIVQLVMYLDELGGANLMRLARDHALRTFGPAQADDLTGAWAAITRLYPTGLKPDPQAIATVKALMAEAEELPIGSVRWHAVAHFKVDLRGGYFLNGKRVSLAQVKIECARLALIGGVVFCYRENLGEQPPPEFEALIAAARQARLPLSFARRDYDPEVKVAEYFLPIEEWPTESSPGAPVSLRVAVMEKTVAGRLRRG